VLNAVRQSHDLWEMMDNAIAEAEASYEFPARRGSF
jgi:hypothetical protein